jgi:hypothetical protein
MLMGTDFWRAGLPPRSRLAFLLLLLLLLLPATARAQVRPDTVRPDTVPGDTVPGETVRVPIPATSVEPDTLPADSLQKQDSTYAVPVFPRFRDRRPTGWAYRRWEWDRESLLRFHGFSLLDLLDQVPGVVVTRTGDFGSPAGVSALGMGGARLRIFRDGYELDPLGLSTPDIQQIGLVDLETVRVELGPGEIRVDLVPMRLPDPRPYSLIEAGTGNYDNKLLRAVLMRQAKRHSTFTAAYDLLSTRGVGFASPYSLGAGRISWGYALSERTGLQLEYERDRVDRTAELYPLSAKVSTLLLRGRSELRPGLVVDGMLGRATRTPDEGDPLTVPLHTVQAAARAGYDFSRGWADASIRTRSGSMSAVAAPGLELASTGHFTLLPRLDAGYDVRTGSVGGAGGLRWSATARAGGAAGLAAFATISGGRRALGLVRDSTRYVDHGLDDLGEEQIDTIGEPFFTTTSTGIGEVRLGTEWIRGEALVGVAAIAEAAGRVVPFGLGFDDGVEPLDVDAAKGVEARASLPVPGTNGSVRLHGWFDYWMDRGGRPYLPVEQARASLEFHNLFYEDQLEPTLRFDLTQRGAAIVPLAGGEEATTDPYALLDLFLQIRILSLRAYLLWPNLLNYRTAFDVPGQRLPSTRLIYGVRWFFRN